MGPSSLPAPPSIVFQLPSRSVALSLKKKNACSAGYTFNLNVIGSSTKFILHVIVLQASLIEHPGRYRNMNPQSTPQYSYYCLQTNYHLCNCQLKAKDFISGAKRKIVKVYARGENSCMPKVAQPRMGPPENS